LGERLQPPGHELVLPPGPQHVELHFGVIEQASPEKIRMEYRELSVSLRSHDWEVKTQMGRGGYSAPACR
jgi:hypothetical protein